MTRHSTAALLVAVALGGGATARAATPAAPPPAPADDGDEAPDRSGVVVVGAEVGVPPDIAAPVRVAAERWLKRSHALVTPSPARLGDEGAVRRCLKDDACLRAVSREDRVTEVVLVHVRGTEGGRWALHVEARTTISGGLDVQWMASFGAEGPLPLFDSLPAVPDAPTGTLTILRTPRNAAVWVSGCPVGAEVAGDVVLEQMLVRTYDVHGEARGHLPADVAATPMPGGAATEVRLTLPERKSAGPWIALGVGGGAVVVVGAIAAVLAVVLRARPPDSDLGHFRLFTN